MKSGKFWLAVLVGGVVLNVLDFVLHGIILHGYYAQMPELFNPPGNPVLFIVTDFVVVLIYAWVYDRVMEVLQVAPKVGRRMGCMWA